MKPNVKLEQSSIKNLVLDVKMEEAIGKVLSKSLGIEMSLVGFIPYSKDYKAQLSLAAYYNLNDKLIVTPYFIRFSQSPKLIPIFRSIGLLKAEEIAITNFVTIGTIYDLIPDNVLKISKISTPFIDKDQLDYIMSQTWDKKNLLKKDENGVIKYFSRSHKNSNDFAIQCIIVMLSALGDKIFVTNDYLCLCKYVNSVTGEYSYTILLSEDVIRTETNKPIFDIKPLF